MDITHSYWEENSNIQHMKYESCNSNDGEHIRLKDEPLYRCCDSNLNFATVNCNEDDSEYNQYKKNKVSRQDPMSHRIIEKRRRDRMNNCLADLSRLIPAEYLKKGRGRIEKTEIIEMAIKHIKYLQQAHRASGREQAERMHAHEQYRLGYQECLSETMRFLVEVEGFFAREDLCVRLINHLQKHCDALLLRDRIDLSTKIPLEKEFSQTSVPSLIPPATAFNSPILRPLSPLQSNPEKYDNSSQLRDMLQGNIIKDEARLTVSPQIISPVNREIIATTVPVTRIQTPDKQNHEQYKHIESESESQKQPQTETKESFNSKPAERVERKRTTSENENYSQGVSLYKFKNNIKQRFSQDLNAENNTNQQKIFKRRKTGEFVRRNSITTETYSSENHSSPIDGSQCSPPSSEHYRISSESETARISPTGSSVSDIRMTETKSSNRFMHLKPDNNNIKATNGYGRYSPHIKHSNSTLKNNSLVSDDSDKANYSVPIFALHAKGSFYIPLTIDYNTLLPYLQHNNLLDILPNVHNIILHPVTINVNFQSNYFNVANLPTVKPRHKLEEQNGWH